MAFLIDHATLSDMSKKSKWAIISSLGLTFILTIMLVALVNVIFPEWNLFALQEVKKEILHDMGKPYTLRPPRTGDFVGLIVCILCIFPVYSFSRYSFIMQSALQHSSVSGYLKAQRHLTNIFRYIGILFLTGAATWGVMMILSIIGVIK